MTVQQADETPLVYPVSETNPPSKHQSDGSFRAVFIVLAVIVVVSAVACFLGRMCNKHHNKSKPSMHGRPPKERDVKHKRNAFHTNDGDIEFGFDKRFSSANGEPNVGRPNSFHEPDMGRHIGRPNSFHEQDMSLHMGRPNSFHEQDMGLHTGRPSSFHEPDMGPHMGRPNSFREQSMGRPDSFREQSMGRPDSFREPYMGRPNSFQKGEFRDDHVRFAGNQDHEMNFKSGTGPQLYYK